MSRSLIRGALVGAALLIPFAGPSAAKGGGARAGARMPSNRSNPAVRPLPRRGDRSGTLRHRDRDKDGRGDRHRRRGRVPWWWYRPYGYGLGFGFGPAFASPFYDPFYHGYYQRLDDEDEDRRGGGNIDIRVSPASAEILVNGVRYGEKGRARLNLPAGLWKIELRAPGYAPQAIDLNVDQGIRYSIERKLEKDRAVGKDGRPLKTEDLD